jgi:hypothetical protein
MADSMGLSKSSILTVGESLHLKMGRDRIIYAGMPDENVYSIVQRKSNGYQGYAWNLFYPKKRTELTIDGMNIYVESVTPEEIRLRLA